jgi:hypothetical protein
MTFVDVYWALKPVLTSKQIRNPRKKDYYLEHEIYYPSAAAEGITGIAPMLDIEIPFFSKYPRMVACLLTWGETKNDKFYWRRKS